MIINDRTSAKKVDIPDTLPLLPVRDVVVFPYMIIPLAVGREKSIKALEEAMSSNRLIFISVQKHVAIDNPRQSDIYQTGTVSEIHQLLKMPDGTLKVVIEGLARAGIVSFDYFKEKGFVNIKLKVFEDEKKKDNETEALMRQLMAAFETYVKLNRKMPLELTEGLNAISDAGRLADTIASHLLVKVVDKQKLLDTEDPYKRLEVLMSIVNQEIEVLNIEKKIQGRVKSQIEKSQKEYYLTEQMKAIQKELKQKDDTAKEIDELKEKVKKAKMSKEATEIADKEVSRLEKMMPYSPEATVIRNYVDWLIALPWSVVTKDNLNIKRAGKVLDEDHYGLEKTKERVLEYLAVLKLVNKIKGPILCFVGPPGVGKTSIGKSIARAIGRKFTRMSLGGVRDEAEIRGHRRTYIGSMPGRIIQSLRKAKSKNPVFLLDEIDKIGSDWRGDPTSALLEVLDPEQNNTFSDHYLDLDFDLSSVMFICTANNLYNIPPTLLDRLETVQFSGYTFEEKFQIAKKYLIPKQMTAHGIKDKDLKIKDSALDRIISEYTKEAGVRNLERELANLMRKIAKIIVSGGKKKLIEVAGEKLTNFLGAPKFIKEKIEGTEVGVATGLAWTEAGGETLVIEVVPVEGDGKFILTGKLGSVMQESAQAAFTYIKANMKKLGADSLVFKKKDFHIHVPEGAVPKDGPSAGIAMVSAFASAITGRPLKKDIAMTGEITLSGKVLAIGGLKEKVIAAYRDEIKTVIFPKSNLKDMEEIPKYVQDKIKFIPVNNIDNFLSSILDKKPANNSKKK